MALKKKRNGGGGGANWMDTYGDMVTLLLCFFVMLYSMSSIDQERWIALVQALNPDAVVAVGTEQDVPPDGSTVTQQHVEEQMDELYQSIENLIQQSNLAGRVSVGRGSGFVFISFDNTVFFDGNSYVLREDGQQVLDQVAEALIPAADSINEIRILGHTAQEVPDQPNNVTADRFLASNRATVVTVYLQEKDIIDPARLVSVGYGEWRPVSDNDDAEGRAQNRRVELIITGLNLSDEMGDEITHYYTMRDEAEDGESYDAQDNAGSTANSAAPDTTD